MHPATPPTPSRRAPRAPKNPRRRVRSESDRKKHAGWRHCPRCNRSVSTNGRNFYHHMHKCDRVYFADLIAKVDSAVAPVSTPLPPPLPRLHSSPVSASPRATPAPPVKMSEMQRVTFLQQLCFLRVYDRTVDAVLRQIEKTDANVCSPAAFEALRRAKGIDAHRVFPSSKHVSPPFSPLPPPVHPTAHAPSNPHLANTPPPAPSTPPVHEPPSALPNGPRHQHLATTPFTSTASINAPALSPTATRPASHTPSPAQLPPTPSSAPASAPIIPHRDMQQTHPIPMQPHTTVALSQQMPYTRNVGNGMHPIVTSAHPSGSHFRGNTGQRDEVMHPRADLAQNHQSFPHDANLANGHATNLSMAFPMNQPIPAEANWRRAAQRYSAPAGTTPYAGALYGSAPLSIRPQMPPVTNATSSSAVAPSTPVSRVASAMSISSVINS